LRAAGIHGKVEGMGAVVRVRPRGREGVIAAQGTRGSAGEFDRSRVTGGDVFVQIKGGYGDRNRVARGGGDGGRDGEVDGAGRGYRDGRASSSEGAGRGGEGVGSHV